MPAKYDTTVNIHATQGIPVEVKFQDREGTTWFKFCDGPALFIDSKQWPSFEENMLNALETARRYFGTGKTPEPEESAITEPLNDYLSGIR